jgi:LPXTG-motif cell wall-anchored protein
MGVVRSAVLAAGTAGVLTLSIGLSAASASADPAAPTVTPNPVAAGSSVTVTGADCTGDQLLGVDVAILNADDDSINYGFVDPSDLSDTGDWSTSVMVPGNTASGTYTVAAYCDDYVTGFEYPDVSLTVTGGTSTSVTLGSKSVVAGGSLHVTGAGFSAGEKVSVTLHSTPVTLATLTATSTGAVSGNVVIPSDTAVGSHEIVLLGETSGSTATAGLTVTAATTTTTGTETTTTTTGTSASTLPSTGANNQVGLIGLALIGLGGSAIVLTRRAYVGAHRRSS